MTLKLWTDGTHTVVAESGEDALEVYVEYAGPRDDGGDPFLAVPDDKVYRIDVSENPETPMPLECRCAGWARTGLNPNANVHADTCPIARPSMTAAEWALKNGRGLLCSTEW